MKFQAEAFAIRCTLMLAVGLMTLSLLALTLRFPAIALPIGIGYLYRRLKRWRGSGDAYGSARASGIGELWRHRMLGDSGLVLGTCGYLGRPSRSEGVRALFWPFLPSPIACRLFFAAFFGSRWMER